MRIAGGFVERCAVAALNAQLALFRALKTNCRDTFSLFLTGRPIPHIVQAMCNTEYEFVACCCNTPGSTNDRQAWDKANFDKLLESLPDPYYIVGDAAHGPSEKMLVPFAGTRLDMSQDAYNFCQSQARMTIEQTFGIMASY